MVKTRKIQDRYTEHLEKARPNTFWRATGIFKPSSKAAHTLALLNNAERRAVEANKSEAEIKRSEAIMHRRNFIL